MSVEDLVPRVREALSISSEYDAETIPAAIRRVLKRLLRDYNFPKSVKRRVYLDLLVGQEYVLLPSGFKRMLNTQFFDSSGTEFTKPLLRRDTFVPPSGLGYPTRYWLEGTRMYFDTKLPNGYDQAQLLIWYQSLDLDLNEDWLTEDFDDVIFNFTCYREAAAMAKKPELQQTFAPLWAEDQRSLAIYLNELEWSGVEMVMRETRDVGSSRYPTDS